MIDVRLVCILGGLLLAIVALFVVWAVAAMGSQCSREEEE